MKDEYDENFQEALDHFYLVKDFYENDLMSNEQLCVELAASTRSFILICHDLLKERKIHSE